MSNFDLQPLNILRPEKVIWRFNTSHPNALSGITSKSLRVFLAKTDTILAEQKIEYRYQPVTPELYKTWLTFYEVQMQETGYEILANQDWYDSRLVAEKKVEGLFFYRADQLVGGAIVVKDLEGKATMAFKASQRLDLGNHKNASFGAIIDYLFLEEMLTQKMPIISGGKSRNAFGVINKFGYLEHKLRFGYLPQLPAKPEFLTSVPLNETGEVAFYGIDQTTQKMQFYALKPEGSQAGYNLSRFGTPEIQYHEILY